MKERYAYAHVRRLIDAPPAAVYAVLADYTQHHPRIMPAAFFSELRVEAGGVGAGTVFHITLRMMGRQQQLHMQVAEPQPGRVLTETNLDTGIVTVFTVTPGAEETHTLVQISSEWVTDGGLRGLFERLVTPLLMRRIFAQQLYKLDQYMHSREVAA